MAIRRLSGRCPLRRVRSNGACVWTRRSAMSRLSRVDTLLHPRRQVTLLLPALSEQVSPQATFFDASYSNEGNKNY